MNLPFAVTPRFARSILALPLAVAGPAAAQQPAVPITVQLGGQTYAGHVAPTTRTATGASVDLPADSIQTIPGGPAPLAVHLDAMDALDPANLRDVRVTWDFGDPDGRRNVLAGYNAAHAYDAPGTYTITRTVDSPAGRQIRGYRVVVAPDARRPVHVSADGNDAADGLTPQTAVRTWARAAGLVRPNTAVLLRRGDRFAVDRTIEVKGDDVRFAPYGDAALPAPVLALSVPRNDIAAIGARGARLVVEGITFDSDAPSDGADGKTFEKKNVMDCVVAGGRGLLVRGCTFRAVCNAVNGNGNPDGVLVEACDAPLETGLRAYFAWMQGTNWTLIDNRAVNSTREHIARAAPAERLNITGNRFSNLDRRDPARGGDGGDFSKTTLSIQKGRVAWVAQNVLRSGPLSVGPLGGADGRNEPQARWVGATFEDNRLDESAVEVQHGAHGATFRNNLVRRADGPAFAIYDFNAGYGRGCDDVTLERNTAIVTGPSGNFVRVGAGATRVRLVRNAFVAPQLVAGAYSAGPVVVNGATTDALALVEGNRWGEPAKSVGDAARRGGPFVIGGQYAPLSAWLKVGGDDKLLPLAAGTLSADGAGVDASRLPAE